MRKFLASWLLGGDVVSWKRMFDIAVDCNDECKKMLKRMEQLFELYRETSEKQIETLNAIEELGNAELKKKIMEILLLLVFMLLQMVGTDMIYMSQKKH